jgi:hypothetical protein
MVIYPDMGIYSHRELVSPPKRSLFFFSNPGCLIFFSDTLLAPNAFNADMASSLNEPPFLLSGLVRNYLNQIWEGIKQWTSWS